MVVTALLSLMPSFHLQPLAIPHLQLAKNRRVGDSKCAFAKTKKPTSRHPERNEVEPKDLRTSAFFLGIVSAKVLRRASLAQDDMVVTALLSLMPSFHLQPLAIPHLQPAKNHRVGDSSALSSKRKSKRPVILSGTKWSRRICAPALCFWVQIQGRAEALPCSFLSSISGSCPGRTEPARRGRCGHR